MRRILIAAAMAAALAACGEDAPDEPEGSLDWTFGAMELAPLGGGDPVCKITATATNNTEHTFESYQFSADMMKGEENVGSINCNFGTTVAAGASGEAECWSTGAACTDLEGATAIVQGGWAPCTIAGGEMEAQACGALLSIGTVDRAG